MLHRVFLSFLFCIPLWAWAQSTGRVTGQITNKKGEPVVQAQVFSEEDQAGFVSTDENGYYTLEVPGNDSITLIVKLFYTDPVKKRLWVGSGETVIVNLRVERGAFVGPKVHIEVGPNREEISVIELDPQTVENIPLPSGNFESLLKTLGLGVSSAGGELSSQYSVRGGNFDENLVYVNDFEIYRPQLIRSGQQEGLSFINPHLVKNIKFSSGGFEARYGDKLSSALDVTYKDPDSFAASIEASLLGISAHAEGYIGNERLTYLAGIRQKSNQYLLSGLNNTEGEYRPSFTDIQALVEYQAGRHWSIEAIANVARNTYQFFPESRITSIGTVDNVKQIEVFFDGSEKDRFETYMGGLSMTFVGDSNSYRLKFLASAYRSDETETFDIIGDYYLYQVESDLGSNEFAERSFGLGYGTFQNFARNYLVSTVANAEHKGYKLLSSKHVLEWGVKYQWEDIWDELNEWQRIDSALYTLPYDTTQVRIWSVLKTNLSLTSNRLMGYLQDTWIIKDDSNSSVNLTAGIRSHYWDVNKEILVSPRAQLSFKPDWERNVVFKIASGVYQQPPFYRELRNDEGVLNKSLRAQKSIHVVLGSDYVFNAWEREFRLITEAYYKHLWDLVPYDIQDVKIRYYGENAAKGYAAGIDFRLNGEFVKDAESWITLSLLQTQEDIEGDFYLDTAGNAVEIGYLPRPTDQRVNFGMLFSDYLPNNQNFKMHLNLLFGTGLPFGPPNSVRYRNALRIPPYRRVDIGFSALLWDKKKRESKPGNPIHKLRSIWTSLEIFNLLGIDNTISYIWIKDNYGGQYAFPNHLTNRRINLRVLIKI